MNVLSAPGEIFFRIFAASHLNEPHADRPLGFLLGFVFYLVLTLVAHWETNYSMVDRLRPWVKAHGSDCSWVTPSEPPALTLTGRLDMICWIVKKGEEFFLSAPFTVQSPRRPLILLRYPNA